MEYMTILYVRYKDGTASKKSIYPAEAGDEGVKDVFVYMGQYMGMDNVASVAVIAMNSIGGIYKNESWVNEPNSTQFE